MSTPTRTQGAEDTGISPAADDSEALLRVNKLSKHFPIKQGILIQRQIGAVKAVDGVSFAVRAGETLGLVGESGCGKSTTGRVITKLLDPTAGEIYFGGRDIAKLSKREMRALRTDIQMIFQDPYSSLNPRHTVGTIVGAPFRIQNTKTEKGVKAEVQSLMERVGLNPEHYNRFPSEFSGGQRQRIGIARALVIRPDVIICDEPVSALDVSIQAQILNLLKDLQNELNLTYLFIAHDLSVVRHISDRVAVMYLGKIVEISDTEDLFDAPRHPYTAALLSAAQEPDPDIVHERKRVLLPGDPPSPIFLPSGCSFHPRCPKAQDTCSEVTPTLEPRLNDTTGHLASCYFPVERGETLQSAEIVDVAAVLETANVGGGPGAAPKGRRAAPAEHRATHEATGVAPAAESSTNPTSGDLT